MKLRTYALLTIMSAYAYSGVESTPVVSMSDSMLVSTLSHVTVMVARESTVNSVGIQSCIQQIADNETQKRGIAPIEVQFATELVEDIPEERPLHGVNVLLSHKQVHFDMTSISEDIQQQIENCRSA